MSGFKNFILRGNLIEIAVAFIIAASFAAVVTAFTNWLTSLLPEGAGRCVQQGRAVRRLHERADRVRAARARSSTSSSWCRTPTAKEKFFPSPEPGTPEDIKLLQEIRDLLSQRPA